MTMAMDFHAKHSKHVVLVRNENSFPMGRWDTLFVCSPAEPQVDDMAWTTSSMFLRNVDKPRAELSAVLGQNVRYNLVGGLDWRLADLNPWLL